MTMEEFLSSLERELKDLSATARQEILADYAEHFRAGRERGRNDADISRALGTPQEIARSYAAERHLEQAENSTSLRGQFNYGVRALLTVMGLGFFNLVFIVLPYFVMVGILLASWIAVGAIAAVGGGAAILSMSPINIGHDWYLNGTSIVAAWQQCENPIRSVVGLVGLGTVFLGALLAVVMTMASRWFVKITLWYVRLNLRLATNTGETK